MKQIWKWLKIIILIQLVIWMLKILSCCSLMGMTYNSYDYYKEKINSHSPYRTGLYQETEEIYAISSVF